MSNQIFLYSIKDVVMGHLAPPFFATSDISAKSMVRDAIEPGSVLSRFPRDYHLYRLGIVDEIHGIVSTTQECVCSVYDLARSETLVETSIDGGMINE